MAPLPTFSQRERTPDPDHPETENPPAAGSATGSSDLPGLLSQRLATPDTHTGTSATSDLPVKADPAAAARLVAGLLGMAFMGVGVLIWRGRRRVLRQPDDDQLRDMAKPAARMLARHIPAQYLNNDLADAAQIAAAFSDYLRDGPLTDYGQADPGIPDDLNDPEGDTP